MNNNKIDCVSFAEEKIKTIKEFIDKNKIAVEYDCFIIGENGIYNPASLRYTDLKQKSSSEAGIKCNIRKMNKEDFLAEMHSTEFRRAILQLPAPEECVDIFNALDAFDDIIDVDNLTNARYFNMWDGDMSRIPATPRGVVDLILHELGDISGKKIAVIGSRSKTTGRYLVPILQNLNATVSMYHSRSKINQGEFEDYDVVISCVGNPRMIGMEHLGNSKKKVLIDVGVTIVDGKAIGDFNQDVREFHRYTPYVNGVGVITRAYLLLNVLESYGYDETYSSFQKNNRRDIYACLTD